MPRSLETQKHRSAAAVALVVATAVCSCARAPTPLPPPSQPAAVGYESGSPSAGTQATDSCETTSFEAGRLRVSQRWIGAEAKCIVMVAADGNGGTSRSFLFNSQGLVLTFGSYGEGPLSRSTGARTHFLLPNVQPLRVERTDAGVLVHTTSGHTVTFDTVSGLPAKMSRGLFQVTPQVSPSDGGGVTLRSEAGIVADFGFMLGGSPHSDPEGRATLRDRDGHECVVGNRDLLSYEREEPVVVVSSPEELAHFLGGERGAAAKCDALHAEAR